MNPQNLQTAAPDAQVLRNVGGQLRASIATLEASVAGREGRKRRIRHVLALLWSAVDALDELSAR